MQTVLMLVGVLLFPVGCLVALLWLGWLEETLDADVKKTERRPAPAPITAVPMRVVPAPVAEAPAHPKPAPSQQVESLPAVS